MLVLTRKLGETIVIGEAIRVTVLEVSGEKIKLGILAPKEVPVHRLEVYEQICTENQRAAQPKSSQAKPLRLSKRTSEKKGEEISSKTLRADEAPADKGNDEVSNLPKREVE